jgi:hypothetical protein
MNPLNVVCQVSDVADANPTYDNAVFHRAIHPIDT